MVSNKMYQVEKTGVHLNRPQTLSLERQIEVIDLCTPSMDISDASATTTTTATVFQMTSLMKERFPHFQSERLSILSCYPRNNTHDDRIDPLLCNISPTQLSQVELNRRRTGAFKPAFDVVNSNLMILSFLREKHQLFFADLIQRLKVDMSLLDYNYTRLNQYMKMLLYEHIHVFNLQPKDVQCIDEKEYPLALEFFLQFDVNMFYMKTCSFRHARPRAMNEGLFCLREPEARYELAACGNCGLCYPQYDMTYRSRKSIVAFSQAHQHTFVNGYQSILNCSVTCHTRNIIYVLTCPCGKVDYVGTTIQSLYDRLQKHREHGNRIMHEFLLGQKNILRDLPNQQKPSEMIRKDRMKLYQHSARCPIAMQIFLDANPQYWRFVPMSLEEAERPEQKHIQRPVFSDELAWSLRSKEDCQTCVEAVPRPPIGFMFSNRQVVLQSEYFHKKRDKELPNLDVDLYNATVVAVLPDTCTDMFRFTIESLFITHAETTLNTIGNVLNPHQLMDYNPWLIRGDEWCVDLQRRPQPKPLLSTGILH